MRTTPPRILLIGSGLAGSLLACMLAKQGFAITMVERRSDPRARGYGGGRSINLALSARGIAALAAAGLADRVMNTEAIAMRGRIMHPVVTSGSGGAGGGGAAGAAGKLVFQPYSSNERDAINSVSRGGLNLMLLKAAAEYANVSMRFDLPCIDVNLGDATTLPTAVFQHADGRVETIEADMIIGTDGAFSVARGKLMKTDRFEYSQSYLKHGYKELHIPSAAELGIDTQAHDGFALDPNALHIWPRGGAMMIALPNRDKTFTCTLFWPFDGEHGLTSLGDARSVRAFFDTHYGDASALMPTLERDYLANPNGALVTVRSWPWQFGGRVCLVGDACHAIVPFYGQGMNAAFEDVVCLSECMAKAGGVDATHEAITRAFDTYQHHRKANADAIADMALENFVEMRDKVGQPEFLYKKRIEQTLIRLFPDRCQGQYNLVSFSTVPYVLAQQRGRELDEVCAKVIARLPASAGAGLDADAFTRQVGEIGKAVLDGGAAEGAAVVLDAATAIDITPPLSERTMVWPGDTPIKRTVLMDMAKGDNFTLSAVSTTVHLGAHADGPNHYGHPALSIGEMPLKHYVGPCQVIVCNARRGERVRVDELVGGVGQVTSARVLLKTSSFDGFSAWNADFCGLSVEIVEQLAARGVITIGVDTPSVDPQTSKAMEAHKAILKAGIAIIEGLALHGVAPGHYVMSAAPLPLMGFDGSPLRALLWAVPGAAKV